MTEFTLAVALAFGTFAYGSFLLLSSRIAAARIVMITALIMMLPLIWLSTFSFGPILALIAAVMAFVLLLIWR
jgi:hypothetical protein